METAVPTIELDEVLPPGQALDASVVHAVQVADLTVGYSPRQIKVDPDHVSALADVADRLPPVVVDERTMTVIDGVHRLEAYRSLGRSHIPAVLFRGSEMEALVMAIQANIQHGKPLSRTERQEAARALLLRCSDRSDRWLGDVCGVSHTTVAVLRRSLSAADAKVRMGRDGRRRPVDPSPGQAAVARVMAENPTASIRQAAGAAGVAPSTVQRVAAGLARSANSSLMGATLAVGEPTLGPGDSLIVDVVSHSSPEGAEAVTWLTRTAVSVEDLHTHLASLPLSRVYQVADECRRRASTWAQMADALEARVRRGLAGL
ncbi:MAG TPA: ParB/RepB/Spo0J family partition protein [Acidimicrobiales bacterium]|nr:ParB/RepB/Spo0J family partition protein [Acidimicrobiales bacterium]